METSDYLLWMYRDWDPSYLRSNFSARISMIFLIFGRVMLLTQSLLKRQKKWINILQLWRISPWTMTLYAQLLKRLKNSKLCYNFVISFTGVCDLDECIAAWKVAVHAMFVVISDWFRLKVFSIFSSILRAICLYLNLERAVLVMQH